MPRGGIPKPTALKIVEGTFRPDRARNEPVARQGAPEPPQDWDPKAREVWDRTVRELTNMGVAATCDGEMLVSFCEAVVVRNRAAAVIAKSPLLIENPSGRRVANPMLGVHAQATAQIVSIGSQFGLSPSARARISVDPVTPAGLDDNPFLSG